MFQGTLRQLHQLLQQLAPGWHPLRLPLLRRLVMTYVAWHRREAMPVRYGFDLHVPRTDRSPFVLSLYLDGIYEPEESRLIQEILKPGDLAFDIGANVGYMTCLMARAVASTRGGEIHAFEPDESHFETLRRNIELNGLQGVIARQNALAATAGEGQLYLAGENLGDHTLVPMPGREVHTIQTITFDEYWASHCQGRQVKLVKVDVQGFELEVLEGMRDSLAKSRIDMILLEFWPARMKGTGRPSAELPTFLADIPYDIEVVSDTGGGRYRSLAAIAAASDRIEADPHLFFNLLLTSKATTSSTSPS